MTGQTINNYYLESIIGEGGMGTVYLARHKYLDIRSAIKVLHIQYTRNPQFKERFINEAVALSKIDSQYIVKIRDFFDYNDNLFLVMEYVKGVGLDNFIRNVFGPIPERRAIEIFKKILLGVHAAHIKGVIHRDIKPSNIILENDDTPKILDFGIAKLLDTDNRMTSPGTKMGSAIYMSPEQVLGREVDLRSDIYSLGITLYEMLTGKNPYDIQNATEYTINSMIVNDPLPLPRSFYPHITPDIEEVILKSTSKDINNRYNNCEEFIIALSEINSSQDYFQASNNEINEQTPNFGLNDTLGPESKTKIVYKTSDELLREVEKEKALKQAMNSVNSRFSFKSNKSTYTLLSLFILLVVSAVIIYSINTDQSTDIEKEVIKEQPTNNKTEQTKPQEKKIDKIEDNTKNDDKEKNVPKKKKYNAPKNYDYNTQQPTKRPRTTFQ